ncbi:hypothetical protein MBLNU459_g5618t1 [Dothideomycetes sp. NU459]
MAAATTIAPLATLSPPSNTRTWLSSPHPSLPIVATACSDKTVRVYSLASFALLSTISGGHKRSIRSVAWKPGSGPGGPGKDGIGESVLATGSFDASAGIWRRWEGTSGKLHAADDGADDDDTAEVDYTRRPAPGDADDDDDEWRFAVILDGHESEIKSLAFSPTSPLLATCSRDKSVWIWEELEDDNFETVAVLQEHEGDVKCVAWHPEEELLVSSSYDDNIRLWREDIDDWGCCACLEGHRGTVWCVEFEAADRPGLATSGHTAGHPPSHPEQAALLDVRQKAGPRLVSSSDDLTIRIWRRVPKEKKETPTGQGRIPSIIKTNTIEERWIEEARLPQVHERAIYSVSWSKKTGRIVSSGSDGKIVVYEERWRGSKSRVDGQVQADDDDDDDDAATRASLDQYTPENAAYATHGSIPADWVAIAEFENAHDVFEVNHVCWAKRCDSNKRSDDEEVIVSTGDDGEVKVWILDH